MIALQAYFDGNVCIPIEKQNFSHYKKAIITVLDEDYVPQQKTEKRNGFGVLKDHKFKMSPNFNDPLDDFEEYM